MSAAMNPIVGAIQAGLVGANTIPKPRFILEVPRFRIRDVANEPAVAQELDKIGYGIISYTWGRFQDKTIYEDAADIAPSFDIINAPGPNQIWWYIPRLFPGNFTIQDIRRIIENINYKYVWWDWACIPQWWDSKGTVDNRRRPQLIGFLPDAHKRIADEEVAKQFYIYTMAKKGVIWLRDIQWTTPLSLTATSLQKTLERRQGGITTTDLAAALLEVRKAVQAFQRVKLEDNWLSSMWTFQEGILLNTDDVIDPRDDRLLDSRNPSQFARLIDKSGKTYTADTCFRGEATLLDITGRATLLACDLAGLIIQAIQAGPSQAQITSELQTWITRLYETGLVGVAADSPLDVLEAAKARGVTTMSRVDYCVNAILGALRVVLPNGTPDGRDNDEELEQRRRALLSTLVDRNGWKMVLLTKPTRGAWDPDAPNNVAGGKGDWLSILRTDWQFSSLGIFITSRVGRAPPAATHTLPTTTTSSSSGPSPASGVGHVVPDNVSLTSPIPYTDNVLLMGALQVRDHIALPPLRHARAVEAALGLPGSDSDAMVVGPEDPDAAALYGGTPPAYGVFCYGLTLPSPNSNKTAPRVAVPTGPAWTACRFYASEAEPAPPVVGPTDYPVKTAHPLVRAVDFASAFRAEAFGANAAVVLLPLEDVSVYRGTVVKGGQPLERVVVLRCAVLTDFKVGPGPEKRTVGGGIFLGIGDFTFKGSPSAVTVQSFLGDGWLMYMY